MKFLAIAAALISVIPAIAGLVINTPAGVVTCQPILLTYGQGTAPYYVSILPGGQVSGTPFHTWPATDATSMTWVVDLPGGTAVPHADSANVFSSCLNSATTANSSAAATASRPASTGSAATAASAATHATSATGTPATAGGDAARPAVTQSTSSNAASGGASAASPVNNAAGQLSYAAYGVGGAVGLIGALLL
ncbi:hypothetical protein MD484_g3781, partial [Candolleomyces efflorescens]